MGIPDNTCVIKDHATRMEIGAGRLINGVLHFSHKQAFHFSSSFFELLHKWFGHPYLSFMKRINNVSFSNTVLDNYSICFQAKQTRDKFDSSLTTTSNLFYLIHTDVWGAYFEKASWGSFIFSLLLMIFLRRFGFIYCLINKSSYLHRVILCIW